MDVVKLLGLLCVSASAALLAAEAGCGGVVAAFTIFPLIRPATVPEEENSADSVVERYVSDICITLDEMSHIYNRTLVALFRQNTRVLRDMSRRSAKLCRESETRRRAGVALRSSGADDMGAWLFGTRATVYLAEVCEALERIVRPACEHVERGAGAFSKEQTIALMRMNDAVDAMIHKVTAALWKDNAAEGVSEVRRQRNEVLDFVRECIREQIMRGGDEENTGTDLLFLTLLGETKTLTLRMSNLLKIKSYSLQSADGK